MTDRRRRNPPQPEEDWDFPERLRERLRPLLPRNGKDLQALIVRLAKGELWLASIVDWGLRTLAAESDTLLNQWVREGIAAIEKHRRKDVPEAAFVKSLFDRCCERLGAESPRDQEFLLQKHRVPTELVKRLVRADWSVLPDERRLHQQVVPALQWYANRLDGEERKLLEQLLTGQGPDIALPGEVADG